MKKLLGVFGVGDFGALHHSLFERRDHQAMRRVQGTRGLGAGVIRNQNGLGAQQVAKSRKFAD